MYNVEFPGLGLKFAVDSVAFEVFGFTVRWYGIIVALGFALAVLYAFKQCKKYRINTDALLDMIIVGAACSLVGARLYYVIFYPGDQYIKHPMEIFAIRNGGIAIYGALIGGILGGGFVAKRKKIKLLPVLDIVSVGFFIGQGIGRWGNFTNQEAFGVGTDNIFRMVSEGTGGVGVHPCFLYESAWCLAGALVLHLFNTKHKRYNGQTLLLYLVLYGVERFIVEGLRTDSLYIPGVSLRVSQVVAAITVIVGVVILIWKKKKRRSKCK